MPNATNSIDSLCYLVPSITLPPMVRGVNGVGCISFPPTLKLKNKTLIDTY